MPATFGRIAFSSEILNDIAGPHSAADNAGPIAQAASLTAKSTTLEAELSNGPRFEGTRFSLVDAAFAPVFRYFNLLDVISGLHVLSGLPAT